MKRGSRRSGIPAAYADLEGWPRPDPMVMSLPNREKYLRREQAVKLYANGVAFDEIKTLTGKNNTEINRLVTRCLLVAPDGEIYGFRALVQGERVKGYERSAAVVHPKGSGSGGCAGALRQLFTRFPDVEDLIQSLYLGVGIAGKMHEARMGLSAIHVKFKEELHKKGFTDEDWPFNTANNGYKAISVYCNALRHHDPRATHARSGADAARRSPVGNGESPLLPCLRPYSAVQLDFHKVDAASVIVLTNDFGKEFEIPLPRWHFGLLVDEKTSAALGFCVALELTPSGDSTLDVISSALSSKSRDFADVISLSTESVLINQLLPEMNHQGFSSLKVDNAWANAAHEVVNNVMSTVGCAVNFGQTRGWWRRSLIERIFGELTRRGLQRLPSTHGSGRGDTRVTDPNAKAVAFRISLSDLIGVFRKCLREHNTADTEGKQFTAPLHCMQLALGNPKSGLFPQPLPLKVQQHSNLMMHMEEVEVKGSVEKNVRPYFNLDRHKHTNEVLAHSTWLIGKKLIAYVDRDLARVVYATVKETGEQLGQMKLSGPWARSDCSWRDRKLLGRAGLALGYASMHEDPLDRIKEEKTAHLAGLKKGRKKRSSKIGLDVARIDAQQKRAARAGPKQDPLPRADERTPEPSEPECDPFGLFSVPTF